MSTLYEDRIVNKPLPWTWLTVLLASSSAAAEITIEQVAPTNTVVALGVKDLSAALERAREHPLLAMWEAQPDGLAGGALAVLPEELRQVLQFGDGEGRLPVPQDAVGAAIFASMNEELGIPEPAFLLFAEYGAKAEMVSQRLAEVISKGAESGAFKSRRQEIRGRTVYSVLLPAPPEEEWGVGDEEEFDPLMMVPGPADFFAGLDTVHLVRSGPAVLVGSDLPSIVDALKTLDGEERRALRDSEGFQGVMKQIGPGDAYVAVLTADLMQLTAGIDPMGMAEMVRPMVRSLFGEVHGIGYGLRFDEMGSTLHTQYSLYMPHGKEGMTALLDTPARPGPPPAFVGEQTFSYTSMNLELDGLVGFASRFIQTDPMLQMQVGPKWAELKPRLDEVFSTLGSTVHVVVGGGEVKDVGSLQPLFAIECRQPEQLQAALAESAADLGLEAREVEGRTVYTMPVGPMVGAEMMPGAVADTACIGVGEQHVLFGPQIAIEQALSDARGAPLATVPVFQRGFDSLPDEPLVGWGYSNLEKFSDLASQLNAPWIARPQPGQDGSMGLAIWYLKSTEDGFVGSTHQLPPAARAVQVGEQ